MASIHKMGIIGYFIGDRRSGKHGHFDANDRGQIYCSECYMENIEREFTGIVTRKEVRENVYHVYVCDGCGKVITGNDQGETPTFEQQQILKGGKQATKTGTRRKPQATLK